MTNAEQIDRLEAIRRELCAYGGEGSCDCKFWKAGAGNGEFTGCAELRELIAHLKGRPVTFIRWTITY